MLSVEKLLLRFLGLIMFLFGSLSLSTNILDDLWRLMWEGSSQTHEMAFFIIFGCMLFTLVGFGLLLSGGQFINRSET